MQNVTTSFVVGLAPSITVTHEARNAIVPTERAGPILESSEDNDTLTTIALGRQNVVARVHWSSSASADFHILLVPETNHLFLGGGQVSGTINLSEGLIVSQESPCLFWAFERFDRYIVEYGELECLLYDLEGRVLDRALVDPPYEVRHAVGGINFVSIVAGSTWLTFPVANDPDPNAKIAPDETVGAAAQLRLAADEHLTSLNTRR